MCLASREEKYLKSLHPLPDEWEIYVWDMGAGGAKRN
jgi:hypothetical protein